MTATSGATLARTSVRIDGCDLSYLRGGSGPPLVYLHGAGGVMRAMPWMERLASSYDLIVPDHPGFGRTSTPEWFDNVHDLAYFYLDVLNALNLEHAHIVGQSIGGWIAAEMAVRETRHIASLVLVAPAGLRVAGAESFDIFLASPEESVRASFHDPAFAERMFAAPAPTPDELEIVLRNRLAAARIAWQPRLYDPHLAKWLHRIDVPALVLWGANDAILPPAMQAEWARLVPAAQSLTIEDCGHIPAVEQTDAFVTAITRFTQGVPV